MTRHDHDATTLTAALELLAEHGFDGLAAALELLLDEVMKLERSAWLGGSRFERSPERRGYANGFKRKRVHSRVGDLELRFPQCGACPRASSPSTLAHSSAAPQRARTHAALAEMYVGRLDPQGLRIIDELCGLEVARSRSHAWPTPDDELEPWRTRPLGPIATSISTPATSTFATGGGSSRAPF